MARRTNNRKFNGNANSHSSQARAKHKKPSAKADVEIYTASFCPHCHDAKIYMKVNKIKFVEHNLERSKAAEKKFLSMGGKSIPLLIVKAKVLKSWNQEAFEKAYKS